MPVNASQLTLLADGKVLIQGPDFFNLALYDPLTASSGLTASRSGNCTIVTATLLTTGKVLDTIIFTDEQFGADIAELYDPSNGVFARKKMTAARRYPTATLIPAPVLFSFSGYGKGQAAIWRATTGQVASPSNPPLPERRCRCTAPA